MEARQDMLFPFGRIERGSAVVLYGAGDLGQIFFQQTAASGYCRITGWIDAKWAGDADLQAPFCRISDLHSLHYDSVLIALADPALSSSIAHELAALGVPEEKIIHGHECIARYSICHPADAMGDTFLSILTKNCGLETTRLPRAGGEIPERTSSGARSAKSRRLFNVALTGTGRHAERMALCLTRRFDNVRLHAVASRDMIRARAFAARHSIPHAYGSCRDLAEDAAVDLVHICTPPEAHHTQAMLLLRHGRHILCEKPFTANKTQAEEMVALARQKGVLLAEGMWPRYLPMTATIKEVLASGVIGRALALNANLLYPGASPSFADNGCYLLALAELVFGRDVRGVRVSFPAGQTPDPQVFGVTLTWDDSLASLVCGNGISDRAAFIYGEKGFIHIENANEYKSVNVFTGKDLSSGTCIARYDMHSGYEYEIRACLDAIEQGKTETSQYPHATSLFVMSLLDEIHLQIKTAHRDERQAQKGSS